MSTPHIIAANVTRYREARGLQKAHLADAAGVPRNWITRLERGEVASINAVRLKAVADVLRVSVDSLLAPPRKRRVAAA